MSSAARSVLVFGCYIVFNGLTLVFIPNVLLGLVQVPEAHEVWIRVLGLVATVLGGYYISAARHELVPFFRATVVGRGVFFLGTLGFALTGLMPWMLVAFGLIDVAGAVWTALELRRGAAPAVAR